MDFPVRFSIAEVPYDPWPLLMANFSIITLGGILDQAYEAADRIALIGREPRVVDE